MLGLTSKQAAKFLEQYGLNIIAEPAKKPIYLKFFEQFNNFLTILLLLAAVFSAVIGEAVDAVLIILIVFLNAAFGLYQELKAEESIAALKKMTITKVRVIRDGIEQEIDSRFLVPGDVVYIEEGTKISADGKIVEARNLEINEAALTGESMPVIKSETNSNFVFTGTIVTRGRGLMKVTSTGMQTKFGQIAANLSQIEEGKTPLQKKLEELTRTIGLIGIAAAILVFVLSVLRGSTYFPAFLLSISLAVAVVPEGLPAVMTITLAIGVKKMAQNRAIIKKLSAIEALGSITLIATDKTGTLTENKMKVKEIFADGKLFKVSKNFGSSSFYYLLLNSILCSTASLVYVADHGRFDVLGDPTEGALLYLAKDLDLDYEIIRKEWKIIDEKPFDSVSKMMTVTVRHSGERSDSRIKQRFWTSQNDIVFSKGAPESILAACDRILIGQKEEKLTDVKKGEIERQVERWARKGLRVLAFTYSTLDSGNLKLDEEARSSKLEKNQTSSFQPQDQASRLKHPVSNMTFLGLVAIHDAPRPEVVEAVVKAKEAGIKVAMITGDNEKTAEAVGVLTGIIKEGDEVINGEDIDKLSDEELLNILPKVKIFARTNPFQKYRLVKLYQKLGEIVAVTGDGVNDALALKQADVGVAMGLVGTDVARETADMVITDDNFATIVSAVEEGRNIIKNLKNAIKYLLSCNVSEAVSLIIGLFLGLPTLFYAIQLLYINLVTDGVPALALSFSPRSRHLMRIAPQKELTLLKIFEKQYVITVGLITSIIVLAAYFLFKEAGLGKTAAFSVLTLIQSFIFIDLWLSHRPIHLHLFYLISPLFILTFLLPFVLQFIIVSNPALVSAFRIQTVSAVTYLEFVFLSALILVGIKGVKLLLKI